MNQSNCPHCQDQKYIVVMNAYTELEDFVPCEFCNSQMTTSESASPLN